MTICLNCNRQMVKKSAIEFKDGDGYWYSTLEIVCPGCGQKVAETVGHAKYDPDRPSGDVRILKD